jgi:hypothetical protein
MTLAAKHRENIKNPAFTNPAFTTASQFARITKSGSVKFGNYTGGKTPCLKIPTIQQLYIAGIPKSGIAKLPHLHWQQNTLVKISKIRH